MRAWWALFRRFLHCLKTFHPHVTILDEIVISGTRIPVWVTYHYVGCTCGKSFYESGDPEATASIALCKKQWEKVYK